MDSRSWASELNWMPANLLDSDVVFGLMVLTAAVAIILVTGAVARVVGRLTRK